MMTGAARKWVRPLFVAVMLLRPSAGSPGIVTLIALLLIALILNGRLDLLANCYGDLHRGSLPVHRHRQRVADIGCGDQVNQCIAVYSRAVYGGNDIAAFQTGDLCGERGICTFDPKQWPLLL